MSAEKLAARMNQIQKDKGINLSCLLCKKGNLMVSDLHEILQYKGVLSMIAKAIIADRIHDMFTLRKGRAF